MKTECLQADSRTLARAAALLRAGEVVAFPTETVYGLGACAGQAEAVARIFAAKNRPADNPLIVHVAHMEQASGLAEDWTRLADKLARAFWPGPLSLIVQAADTIPSIVTAGLDSVAIRMPSHPTALELIRLAGPLAAPSANTSGRPSPVQAAHVMEDMRGKIPLVIDGGACEVGVESTVVDVRKDVPIILRPGDITPEQIRAVCGACEVARGVFEPVAGKAASPGMLHRHYAPHGQATLVEESARMVDTICDLYDQAAQAGLRTVILSSRQHAQAYGVRRQIICDAQGDMNHGLFTALREADAQGYERILLEGRQRSGKGMAYMNRALRAAGFHTAQ